MANFDSLGLTGTDPSNLSLGSQTTVSNIDPQFFSIDRVYAEEITRSHIISTEEYANSGWLTGRRPTSGQLYPRGVYNK